MSDTKRRKRIGRLALVLGSLLVSLVAAELVFRAQLAADDAPGWGDDGGWRERYIRMNETIYRRSDDPGLVYEPAAGASVPMEYGEAGFNLGGMRDDREHAPRPEPGVTRVGLLGDSLVWSEFLALHDSVPRRLEEALGQGFEVLPFGVTGYDTTQEAIWYERAARPYHPDVVVLVFCMNDLMIMSGPFERFANPEDRARKDAQEAQMRELAPVRRETIDHVLQQREREATSKVLARALGLYERWRYDAHYLDEYLVSFEQPAARERVRRAIRRLGAAIEADGARAVFVISPVLEAWAEYHWGRMHTWLREEAEAAGFLVIDPLDEWRRAGERAEQMRVSGDNLHYDGSGARVFGRTVAEHLRGMRRGSSEGDR